MAPLLLPAICGQLPTPALLGQAQTAPCCLGQQRGGQAAGDRAYALQADPIPVPSCGGRGPQLWLPDTHRVEGLGWAQDRLHLHSACALWLTLDMLRRPQAPGRCRGNVPFAWRGPPIFCLPRVPINLNLPLFPLNLSSPLQGFVQDTSRFLWQSFPTELV